MLRDAVTRDTRYTNGENSPVAVSFSGKNIHRIYFEYKLRKLNVFNFSRRLFGLFEVPELCVGPRMLSG